MAQDLGAGVAVGCKATFQILSYGYVKVTAAVHFELALQFKIHCGLFFFVCFFIVSIIFIYTCWCWVITSNCETECKIQISEFMLLCFVVHVCFAVMSLSEAVLAAR